MAGQEQNRTVPADSCACLAAPGQFLVTDQELGMDENFAEISLLVCARCGQYWLKYFYEIEAFTASGRWYLGALKAEQVSAVNVKDARAILENLDWYFYGGSYYGGRSGKASGRIYLSP
jgi:hypothetical protein